MHPLGKREVWIQKIRNLCYPYDCPGPFSAGARREGRAARDTGLKRADFDAMTAAARIEYCDRRKGINCDGLATRSQPVGHNDRDRRSLRYGHFRLGAQPVATRRPTGPTRQLC